ncbi:hypothetical protein PSH03_004425 [Micromonospora sp. PSH03]|uniref:hypothetical protein n=1 Tax=Micromonospora salmantinae TaxID=2911211 RepID=UPI001EE942B2|nr:hypothetical protein [Micromonospora salmantinae]MCG5458664.1 hypothetical protein [Micromonospora salmantinae]
MRSFGKVTAVGVEGTGSYGAGFARYLASKNVSVREVDRSDRRARRVHGKSDPIDAIAAARTTLAGTAMGTPRTRMDRWRPSVRSGSPAEERSRPAPPRSIRCAAWSPPPPSPCEPT